MEEFPVSGTNQRFFTSVVRVSGPLSRNGTSSFLHLFDGDLSPSGRLRKVPHGPNSPTSFT